MDPVWIPRSTAEYVVELERKATEIQLLSGHTLDDLINLFAQGYIMACPEPPIGLEEIIKRYGDTPKGEA